MRGSWFAKGGSAVDGVTGDCGVLVGFPVSKMADKVRKSVRRKGMGCRSALTSRPWWRIQHVATKSVRSPHFIEGVHMLRSIL
jgi:hypothetical protein